MAFQARDRNSADIARRCRTNDAGNDGPKTEITYGLVEVRGDAERRNINLTNFFENPARR